MRDDDRWPGHPRLLPDESFSSWFARTAAANGLRPGELFRIVQPGEDHNPRDLDRHVDGGLLGLMADKTGIPIDDLRAAGFHRWTGRLFPFDDGLNKLPWLPPAGREGGRRCFGQQVCPHCLRADERPYARLIWRLSFITVCPIHGRLLLDRCLACAEPFSLLGQIGSAQIDDLHGGIAEVGTGQVRVVHAGGIVIAAVEVLAGKVCLAEFAKRALVLRFRLATRVDHARVVGEG